MKLDSCGITKMCTRPAKSTLMAAGKNSSETDICGMVAMAIPIEVVMVTNPVPPGISLR